MARNVKGKVISADYGVKVYAPVYGKVTVVTRTVSGRKTPKNFSGIGRVFVSRNTITLCDTDGKAIVRFVRGKVSTFTIR